MWGKGIKERMLAGYCRCCPRSRFLCPPFPCPRSEYPGELRVASARSWIDLRGLGHIDRVVDGLVPSPRRSPPMRPNASWLRAQVTSTCALSVWSSTNQSRHQSDDNSAGSTRRHSVRECARLSEVSMFRRHGERGRSKTLAFSVYHLRFSRLPQIPGRCGPKKAV